MARTKKQETSTAQKSKKTIVKRKLVAAKGVPDVKPKKKAVKKKTAKKVVKKKTAREQPAAETSKKRVVGNPAKTEPFRWKKGESGNPFGRPKKGNAIAEVLRRIGEEPVGITDPITKKKLIASRREQMLRAIYYDALYKSDNAARAFIAERTEGKVAQKIINTDVDDSVRHLADDELDRHIERMQATLSRLT